MENNLAYRVYGGAGGNGGNGGLDWTVGGAPTMNLGGAGGDGGDGSALGSPNGTSIFNNTGAKTWGGAAGVSGSPPPVANPTAGNSIGARLRGSSSLVNNALISHTFGVYGGGPSTGGLVYNCFISATTTFTNMGVFMAGDNVINVAPGFVDWPGDDYHLTGCGAPAAEAGTGMALLTPINVTEDGDGELRPWGYFDVGYDEYWRSPLSATPFQGVITDDTTWSGDYLLTGDVVITSGAALTVSPGATVYANAADGANLGNDLNRIEIIVRGALRSGTTGGITTTFTVTGCNPAPGQWHGIRFEPGSDGYLDPTVIEYGAHGVVISTTKPVTIADSVIRYNRHAPSTGNAWGAGIAIFAGTHLITNTAIYSNTVLAGAGGAWAEGGGVHIVSPAGPSLFQNCILYDNHAQNPGRDAAGGGMNVLAADPILRHCEVYSNQVLADQRAFGGGVNLDNSSGVIEADSFIHDNTATALNADGYGGGVSIGQAMTPAPPAPIIRNSRVTSNALNVGPAWGFGGGIGFYEGSWTAAIISDTLIAGNVNFGADACGGGIGMAWWATADRFDGNLVRNNLSQATGGGGGAGGGGMCLRENNVVSVTNNLVFDNRADDVTGAWTGGGGIYADGPQSYVINNTVISNTALGAVGDGGGVYLWLNGGVLFNNVVVSNTAGNDGGGVYWAGGVASVGFNDVWGNIASVLGGNEYDSSSAPPPTDIYANPLFVGAGDLATYYHLRQGSPCVDAGIGPGVGIPNEDYDDQSRPLGSGWEIGFDEVQSFIYTKQVDALTATIGSDLVYTIIITNPDTIAPLANGWLTDVLPLNTTYTGGPTCNLAAYGYDAGSRTAWWNGSIPANNTLTCVYTVTVDRGLSDGTIISNTAFVTVGAQGGWTNHVKTEVYAPVLTITKRASGGPVAGAPLLVTVSV